MDGRVIVVTGAAGFVGGRLCPALAARGWRVRAVTRAPAQVPGAAEVLALGDITAATDWSEALAGATCVAHLAARVHLMHDAAADPLAAHRLVNRDATLALGRGAATAGVTRLVFLSTVKVMGEASGERPFTEADPVAPADPYAVSKAEAEAGLFAIGRETGLAVCALRPPLVYGPGVGANFLRLLRLAASGLPLPLGAINNRRSLVYVDNLAVATALCCEHEGAAGQAFLVADGEDFSTPGLIRALARALGRPARLIPVPVALLELAARLVGKRDVVRRLTENLAVDAALLGARTGFVPPYTAAEGFAETARWFSGRP